jgi:hypothetical protein
VHASCKLRINIIASTARLLQLCWAHTNVCANRKH